MRSLAVPCERPLRRETMESRCHRDPAVADARARVDPPHQAAAPLPVRRPFALVHQEDGLSRCHVYLSCLPFLSHDYALPREPALRRTRWAKHRRRSDPDEHPCITTLTVSAKPSASVPVDRTIRHYEHIGGFRRPQHSFMNRPEVKVRRGAVSDNSVIFHSARASLRFHR